MDFLPVTYDELKKPADFVLITGDAYVDHPSFGAAVIGRVLESYGYSIGIIAQPNWKDLNAFKVFGQPRLGFLITSGNLDSMVNHYTVAKKPREKDLYSPGGQTGLRPDRAAIVYANKVREAYAGIPIILGGLEVSLRRLSHYDYWDNKVRRSILLDSGADILVYGMGENQIVEIAEALNSGVPISELSYIKGTVYKTKNLNNVYDYILLPSYKDVSVDKKKYAESFMLQYSNAEQDSKTLAESYQNLYVVQNKPMPPLDRFELDRVYGLNYMRSYHPMYKEIIPAIKEVKFSITSSRGCFGSCNFCALSFHQGRVVHSRSHNSILQEALEIINLSDFKGYIHDVGGPTANFREPACEKQRIHGACKDKLCLFPKPCKNLKINHSDYLALLKKLRSLPKVKKVFIRSGLRFDYLIYDKNDSFFNELVEHHISGQLKVAPEHISDKVLEKMGKPNHEVYERFVKKYKTLNEKHNKKQFLIPYLMSSHPGCNLEDAVNLAEYLKSLGYMPEQVQDFYPTPGTLSTCMYYTELDPRTMQKVYSAKHPHDKAMQRALMQYRLPQNYRLVIEALRKAERTDLIGFEKSCLIRPPQSENAKKAKNTKKESANKQDKRTVKKRTIRNVHKKPSIKHSLIVK